MMPTWLAGLIAVAAITVTYISCVRPHLRGRGSTGSGGSAQDADVHRQVAALREELRALRSTGLSAMTPAPRKSISGSAPRSWRASDRFDT
jgi:hypothetical protein